MLRGALTAAPREWRNTQSRDVGTWPVPTSAFKGVALPKTRACFSQSHPKNVNSLPPSIGELKSGGRGGGGAAARDGLLNAL